MSNFSVTVSEGDIILHSDQDFKMSKREYIDLLFKPMLEDKEFQDIAIDTLIKKELVRLNHSI